jgi:hypothetical protein
MAGGREEERLQTDEASVGNDNGNNIADQRIGTPPFCSARCLITCDAL